MRPTKVPLVSGSWIAERFPKRGPSPRRMIKEIRQAVVVSVLAAAAVHGADWPQFRGPTGDGLAQGVHPPIHWSPTENVAWKAVVPGRGRSSPVLLGDRIWLTTAMETNVRTFTEGPSQMLQAERVVLGVVCLDQRTGQQLYSAEVFSVTNPAAINSLNSYATPTPVVEKDRLFCDFGTFGTACLAADTGQVLWKREFQVDHAHGPGSSPVLCGGLLVLVRDGRNQQYVVALNQVTGETVWKSNRPPLDTPFPEFRKSFSTPLVVEVDGHKQLLSLGAQWLVAYEPETGKEIWRVNDLKGESAAPRPVFGRGVVYFSTGVLDGRPQLWAVRTNGRGDVTESHVVWKLTALLGFMPSPLLFGSELYVLNDDGFLHCLDAADGKVLGKARLGGKYAASPVYADGRIYCFSREGKTTVLEAGSGLKILAENQLDGPVFASPAFGGSALYLRTDSHLYCVSVR
jgi:outer membrane protein assembly factor BamB